MIDEDGYDDYYADADDEVDPCTICDGDAYGECPDELQCCRPHVNGWCPCYACGGSGARSEQWAF